MCLTFIEKRKVIRKLEQLSKKAKVSKLDQSDLTKQLMYQNYLTYINHFPPLWKYLSLFVANESEEAKKIKQETIEKVLKMANVKASLRDKELWEADASPPEDLSDEEEPAEKKKEKSHNLFDPFFVDEDEDQDKEAPIEVEKRPVMRDGRVPKL